MENSIIGGKKMGNLLVKQMVVGDLQTNCYLISHPETLETILVDPADEADRIQREIEKNGLKPVVILLTHGHFDHMGAADLLRKRYQILVYCSETEREVAENMEWNLSGIFGNGFSFMADAVFRDKEILHYLGEEIEVIATPGHTQGSCCFYFRREGFLLSGDTLFAESVGRTDFPTGSGRKLQQSIVERIYCLPEETVVYPGHYGETTIGHEKKYNPCV